WITSRDGFYDSPSRMKDGVMTFSGTKVMVRLRISKYRWPFGPETFEYGQFQRGCIGLNMLRLNTEMEPFSLPGARAFATLDAAIEAQKGLIRTSKKDTLIVITAFQDSYLDKQLTPFL